MRLLIVEDNADIAAFLKRSLEAESYAVDVAYDGDRGSYAARTNDYDAVILDNILPKKSGALVCREIREAGRSVPIIMLSAVAETAEKIELLKAGADDYMTKPYSFEELRERIRAHTRRRGATKLRKLRIGTLEVDLNKHEARVNDALARLTRKEFSLLVLLAENIGTVVSRGAMMEHVWDMNGNPLSRTIETHILNIRKKIAEAGGEAHIHSVPGRGYKMELEQGPKIT